MNQLFYGDNLAVLRESIAHEMVDLRCNATAQTLSAMPITK